MAEKRKFLNWVGFKTDDENQPSSVERIRELESKVAELSSRRDIKGLSKQEFEILATETAMAMIRSAQARESKANSTASRLVAETNRLTKEEIEAADAKARPDRADSDLPQHAPSIGARDAGPSRVAAGWIWRIKRIEGWLRRHMRKCFWIRWHNRAGRKQALKRLGAKPHYLDVASSRRGAWRVAAATALQTVLSKEMLQRYGLGVPSSLWAA